MKGGITSRCNCKDGLVSLPVPSHIPNMASPILDFSHLTPDERIELAEQLWDSLPVSEQRPTGPVIEELGRRRAALETDGDLGEPWNIVVKEIGERGA